MDWRDIPGWFNFQNLYDEAVRRARSGDHFVEVGCWMGRSTVYLAKQIRRSGKSIALDAVDTWEGSPTEKQHRDTVQKLREQGKTLRQVFDANLAACGVADLVRPICGRSTEVAELYPDASLALVYIDADHRYECVAADIEAWLPKVRKGGCLAGHDYNTAEGVRRAVKDVLGSQAAPYPPNSWILRR